MFSFSVSSFAADFEGEWIISDYQEGSNKTLEYDADPSAATTPATKKVLTAQHVPVTMNAKFCLSVKVEAVVPFMALLAIQLRIVADIKAAIMVPVNISICRG